MRLKRRTARGRRAQWHSAQGCARHRLGLREYLPLSPTAVVRWRTRLARNGRQALAAVNLLARRTMSVTRLTERTGRARSMVEPALPGLTTDLYELTMAASYLRHGMTGPATFSLFLRRLPAGRGFVVATGLDDGLRFLEEFHFEPDELDYLSGLGFDAQAIDRFRELRFTGSVRAVPEGAVILANEPIVEVAAPIAEAQLVETYLLNQVTFQSAIATKAARCRIAAIVGHVSVVCQ